SGDPRRRFRATETELRRLPAQPAVLRARRALPGRRAGARHPAARRQARPDLWARCGGRCAGCRGQPPGAADEDPGHAIEEYPARSHRQPAGRPQRVNSLAAIAVATELGIDDAAIGRALAGFQGIDRRMQHVADIDTAAGTVTVVDDYGHHPTEVAATL